MICRKVKINIHQRKFSFTFYEGEHFGVKNHHAAVGFWYQPFFLNGDPFFTGVVVSPAAKPELLIEQKITGGFPVGNGK